MLQALHSFFWADVACAILLGILTLNLERALLRSYAPPAHCMQQAFSASAQGAKGRSIQVLLRSDVKNEGGS